MKIDCNYDKIRIMHDLLRLKWFINKHAIEDAKKAGHEECEAFYQELANDLDRKITKLKDLIKKDSLE